MEQVEMDSKFWKTTSLLLAVCVMTVRYLPVGHDHVFHTLKIWIFQSDGWTYTAIQSTLAAVGTDSVRRMALHFVKNEIVPFKEKLCLVMAVSGLFSMYSLAITPSKPIQPKAYVEPVHVENILTEAGIIQLHRREDWGAAEPNGDQDELALPAKYMVVTHTADTARVETTEECKAAMKNLQRVAFQRGFADISYNYLVCNDGHIYEGRGHLYKGATAKGWNDGIGFAFIGTFVDTLPSPEAIYATKAFLQHLADQEVLTSDFSLYALRQVRPQFPDAPGEPLYHILKQWKGKGTNPWRWA